MTIYFLLAHQCTLRQPGLASFNPDEDQILLVEEHADNLWREMHQHRIVHAWSIQRHFTQSINPNEWPHFYMKKDRFEQGLDHAMTDSPDASLHLHWPTDWHLRERLKNWIADNPAVNVNYSEETGFIIPGKEWESHLPQNGSWKLDPIYRQFRKTYNILMTPEGKPEGGAWSFDKENRKKVPQDLTFPAPAIPDQDSITKEVIDEVSAKFPDTYGDAKTFGQPVTETGAGQLLAHFISHRLVSFGDYQDAMRQHDPYMSHSILSAAINASLLDPMEVIQAAEKAYHDGLAPLNAVEGFIRQILGWREYIRGVYLVSMPSYQEVNALGHNRDLPDMFWTGETRMLCMADTVKGLLETGYTHHIQRLMILGNFANLIGAKPQQVSNWFYTMYTDALDWVVLPNVLGMALFADGGSMSTKPYVASGKYVQRMSHYCKDCAYNVNEKYGPNACPFNSLYWDFLERHEEKFRENPRMKVIYKHLDNRDNQDITNQKATVKSIFSRLDRQIL